jgi:Raf kinase inhibitor-like YbhB/YbcL family protein
MPLSLSSPAFEPGREIPARYTSDGADVSPPLSWSGAPDGTRSFALVIEDPDAPDPAAPKRTFAHWVVYDLPAEAASLAEAVCNDDEPLGAHQGLNDWNDVGYRGPAPPIGRHRYVHKLYALDTAIGDAGAITNGDLDRAIQGHVLEQAELIGTYARQPGR